MLAGVEPVSARVLETAQGLKAISRNGGIDSIDAEAAERSQHQNPQSYWSHARGVAELANGFLFMRWTRAIPAEATPASRPEHGNVKKASNCTEERHTVGCGKNWEICTSRNGGRTWDAGDRV